MIKKRDFFTTMDRDLAKSLVEHYGFEPSGEDGDNITRPAVYYVYGDKNRLYSRQLAGIRYLSWKAGKFKKDVVSREWKTGGEFMPQKGAKELWGDRGRRPSN